MGDGILLAVGLGCLWVVALAGRPLARIVAQVPRARWGPGRWAGAVGLGAAVAAASVLCVILAGEAFNG